MQQKRAKTTMQMPDFSVSKTNQEKAYKLIGNFMSAAKKSVQANTGEFSTVSAIMRFFKKDKQDPTEKYAIEAVKRMEKDKIHAQIALQISEITSKNLQSSQMSMLIKMIPYFVGLLGVIVSGIMLWNAKPLSFENQSVQIAGLAMAIGLPIFVWGLNRRADAKADMLASNILLQAASAYASAKMQGKGAVAAMQNLGEMKRRAKAMEEKNKKTKKKK